MAAGGNLDSWLDRLNASSLPVFAQTVREVSNVAADRGSSAKDLSEVVSKDAAMTARLIHIANSSLFNVQNRRVDSISSAVVMMGFDAVRDLAVSVSVLDHMLKGNPHERVGQTMAHAFHAAAHASALARASKTARDEVFVGALLREVGSMAFWGKGADQAEALHAALCSGESAKDAEQRVLGFELSELNMRLAELWSLGDMARLSYDPKRLDEDGVACVVHGHELAAILEQHGWDSAECQAVLRKAGKRFGLKPDDLKEMALENVEAATALASKFGVSIQAPVEAPAADEARSPETCAPSSQAPTTNADAQLKYLNRISLGVEDQLSRDELMNTLVEGVHRCLDARCCWFLLLTPDRDSLIIKYASGIQPEPAKLRVEADNALTRALQARKPGVSNDAPVAPWIVAGHQLACGVHIGDRPVGVLVAQCTHTFDESRLAAFRQFAQQIPLVLTQAS